MYMIISFPTVSASSLLGLYDSLPPDFTSFIFDVVVLLRSPIGTDDV